MISYVTGVLSTVLENPGIVHWKAVDHAVRYLSTTAATGITYRRDAPTTKLYGAVEDLSCSVETSIESCRI